MKTAKELYGDATYWNNYQPMLNEFGKREIQVDTDDYQGDSFVLYRSGERYGYLNFGWGSCSGCDALQACDSIEEVQELMDKLYNNILWFPSFECMMDYFSDEETLRMKWEWHSEEFQSFRKQVLEL